MVGAERIELSKLSHPVMSRNPFPFGTYANSVRFNGPYVDASDKLALKHITDLNIDGTNSIGFYIILAYPSIGLHKRSFNNSKFV